MFTRLKTTISIAALSFAALSIVPMSASAQSASAPAATTAPAAETTAPAAPAPTAPVATTSKEVVDNPYGLKAMWAQGDFVSKGTLIILIIMSMGSWYILITKLYESLKIAGEAKAARKGFFKHASLVDATKTLKEGSAFRFIAEDRKSVV